MHTQEIALTILVAIIGSSAFATFVQVIVQRHYAKKDRREDDLCVMRKAVAALAHDAYIHHCRYLLNKDEITEDELENHQYLYRAYHSQGLNGTGDRLHELVLEKPVHPTPNEFMTKLP